MGQTAIVTPQIIDSTSIGRDLLTAADQAAAQSIIGVTGVDVTADYTWTGDHTFDNGLSTENITSSSLTNTYASAGSHTYTFGVNPKYFMNATNFRPATGDEDIALGIDTRRWASVASVDGDFSGVIKAAGGLDIDSGQMHIKHAGSLRLGIGGAGIFMYEDILPNYSTITNGTSTKRWGNIFSVDGDFSGSITVDTDGGIIGSDYLRLKNTSGTAFYVGSNLRIIHDSTGFYPNPNGVGSIGKSDRRFSDVYSVDGDFSGTLGAVTVQGQTDNLALQSNNATSNISLANSGGVTITSHGSIYQQFLTTGVAYRQPCYPIFDGSTDLGLSTNRWGSLYSVDGDFSGTVSAFKVSGDGVNSLYIDQPISGSSTRLRFAGNEKFYFTSQQFRPAEDGTIDLGLSSSRWENVYSVDGDFSGTVTTNEIESDTGNMFIRSSSTSPIYISHNGALTYGLFNTTFQPQVDDAVQLGSTTKRWSQGHFANVNSVNADFSGTVTASTIQDSTGTGSISLTADGGSLKRNADEAIRWGFNFLRLKGNVEQWNGGAGNFTLGTSSVPWNNVHSIDGDFSGSVKQYNLGSEGDTDTEYLETSWDSDKVTLYTKQTGAGLTREMTIGNSSNRWRMTTTGLIGVVNGGTKFSVSTNDIVVGVSRFKPANDDTTSLGLTSKRWAAVNTVDIDASGDVVVGGDVQTSKVKDDSGSGGFLQLTSSQAQLGAGSLSVLTATAFNVTFEKSLLFNNTTSSIGSTSGNRLFKLNTQQINASDDVVMAANVDFTGLPTSDPAVAGRLWNDGGTMKISAG